MPILAVTLVALGCSNSDGGIVAGPTAPSQAEQPFPDVVEAGVTSDGDRFTVTATVSSPYDTEDRYADAFRVLGPEEQVLGVRELTHPHPDEQPFTRSLRGLVIPEEVTSVTVQARDLENGWGGHTVTAGVPGR